MAASFYTLPPLLPSEPPHWSIQRHPSPKQLHAHLFKSGLHRTHYALGKLIQSVIAPPSPDLDYALLVFASIPNPTTFMWNTLFRGISAGPAPVLALSLYVEMLLSGAQPNSYTFPFVLKCCGKASAVGVGRQVHAQVLKIGVGLDAFVHTSLISMYARGGEIGDASKVFESSCRRDAVSYTALVSGCAASGYMVEARRLFEEMPVKDVVAWNAVIAGYSQVGLAAEALGIFREMLEGSVEPNESTVVSVLSACAQMRSIELGTRIRSWIGDRGLGSNVHLANGLIDMYSKCGDLGTARVLFDGASRRDVVSWNVMIGGYKHAGEYKEALALFSKMQSSSEDPNEITLLSVLPACAYLGALDLGKWIHTYVDKHIAKAEVNHSTKISLYTSLIDMYAKCGSIDAAQQVFLSMQTKNLPCCNAMVSGFAMHGHSSEALKLFHEMVDEGIEPDDITFVGILSACSHAGLVEVGRQFFHSMITDYKIKPKIEHYGCMVDLYGRAGLFGEAQDLIDNMDIKPDGAIWGTLLGACRIHGKVELAEIAAKRLLEVEPENHGGYILLSNTYAAAGRWDDVARLRTKLHDGNLKKLPACTSIEVDSIVHEFLVGDKAHPQSDAIYKMLIEMDGLLESAGHVPDTSEVGYDLEEEWKEGQLSHHSEKLAIAFGLLSTKRGSTIRIVKNLRICSNCHSATKLISKIFNREIIARDRSRFHHFKDGKCSCDDYW